MRALPYLLAGLLLTTSANAFERYYLVKISGFDGKKETRIMSQDEFKEFEKQLRTESRMVSKAQRAAKKEWDENREKGDISFPTFKARRVTKSGSYDSREKADKKLAAVKEREYEKAEEEKKKNRIPYTKANLPKIQAAKLKAELKQSQERKAYDTFARHLKGLTGGEGAVPVAAAPASTSKDTGKKGQGNAPIVEATITGTLKQAAGNNKHPSFYVAADEGQKVEGLIPWGISIPLKKVLDKTVTEEMVGKKVTIHFLGEAKSRKPNVKITVTDLKSIKVVE